MTTEVIKYVDEAMFQAAPMNVVRDKKGGVIPSVKLLWMTPAPLSAVAAMARMYKGIPTYDLHKIERAEIEEMWVDANSTHLKAPLEAIKLHFFIEGVTRSFTHQMVRQRTAVYAQESMRFAVKDDLRGSQAYPPSLADLNEDDPKVVIWNNTIDNIGEAYNQLVAAGIPAEDARGLMPHAVTTRLNYITDLRNLVDHAGNRLCTQAQFEWRSVFTQIVQEIAAFGERDMSVRAQDEWQFQALAGANLFKPVCYSVGRCPFQAGFDRACTIRERADLGRFDLINPAEWMLDPTAARSGGSGH